MTQKDVNSLMQWSQESNIKLMTCPFCRESGYDLSGLKSHILADCDVFRNTENLKWVF